MRFRVHHAVILGVLVTAAFVALAQSGGDYLIERSTVDDGGGRITGGDYNLVGSIGQPDAGDASGGAYVLDSGFVVSSVLDDEDPTPTAEPTGEPTVTAEPTDDPNPTAEPTTSPDACEGVTQAICRLAPADGGTIATADQYVPSFRWRAVEGAEWYAVYVSTPDFQNVFQFEWYQASDVCDASGICTTALDVWVVGSGEFDWWMTYWSPEIGPNFANLWEESNFSITMPATGDLNSLTGTANVTGSGVTVQWDAEPNTLWYNVWVGPDTYDGNIFFAWQNAAEICMSGTCTIEIAGSPPAGEYQLWLQAWNPVGIQPWTQITSFSITP